MYVLKTSDSNHQILGQSTGNRQDEPDGSFWITGWSEATRQIISIDLFYTLQFPDGHSNSVEVLQIGGAGMGLEFRLNQKLRYQYCVLQLNFVKKTLPITLV